jgi:hypothetical protein
MGRGRPPTHGMSSKPEYHIWASMKNRCTDKQHMMREYYTDKGISVCEEWKEFKNFYRDMGDRPGPDYQLDRINNDLGYCKDNCQWITQKENLRKQQQVKKIMIDGKEFTTGELSQMTGISIQNINQRWRKGDRGQRLIRPLDKRGRKRIGLPTIFPFFKRLPLEYGHK